MTFQELEDLGLMKSVTDGIQLTELFSELLEESLLDIKKDPEFNQRCKRIYQHPANQILQCLFSEDRTRFDNDFIICALSIRVLEKIGAYKPDLAMLISTILKYEQKLGNFVLELKQKEVRHEI